MGLPLSFSFHDTQCGSSDMRRRKAKLLRKLFRLARLAETVSDTDKVLLWKFLADNGTVTFMRYDRSDNALVFATS